ncbi:MAG: T9SS type A sorting domain-containing protein [Bacteroidia bacterium]|nr:T9SS type A sorting domain-containing protein [Bacteroidia bacterium]
MSKRHRMRVRTRQRLRISPLLKKAVAGSGILLAAFTIFFIYGNLGSSKKALASSPSNDNREDAYLIPDPENWYSGNAAFSTLNATPDQAKGDCWNNGPNNNVWFRFTAVSEYIHVVLSNGGPLGTLRYPFLMLCDSAGNQIACAKYAASTGTLEMGSTGLLPGTTYFISVDNNSGNGYRGSFSLSVESIPSNDYIQGAYEISNISNWSSANAEFSTMDATPDGPSLSCYASGPFSNRWFKFHAVTNAITVRVSCGSTSGTLRYPYIAIWDSSLNLVGCAQYAASNGSLELSMLNLNPDSLYYISVDNHNNSGYRGTFTLQLNDTPTYDFREGALELPSTSNWTSGTAVYSTIDATPDGQKGSCWNSGPNFNRWFTFTATTTDLTVRVITGGSYGTMRYPFISLWDSSGNDISCAAYATSSGVLELSAISLSPGMRYYLSVDNHNNTGYRGTFTLYVNDLPTYDFKKGAIQIPSTSNWTSDTAAYSTMDATGDESKGSCWNSGPNFNRWFKFTASDSSVTIRVMCGGNLGTLRYPLLALWDSAGAELGCQKYATSSGVLELSQNGLIPGNTYYISVDNHNNTGYRGTFTLYVNDKATYDMKSGAIVLTDLSEWCSDNAAFSTLYATPDETKGSCWSSGPNNNVWFKFQASTQFINIKVKTGGAYGTMRYSMVSLRNSSGSDVACAKYSASAGTVELNSRDLVPGQWYFLQVDNYNSESYRGTFSLCIDDTPGYDYPEGAIELTQLSNWESLPAQFSTQDATADGPKGSCWNTGPNNNRWFKFNAAGISQILFQVKTGGSDGTLRYPYIAFYNDQMVQIGCARYTTSSGTLGLTVSGLIPNSWYYVSVDNYAGNPGTFTLKVNGANTLPIELASFDARADGNRVLVSWETAAEINNEYFTVERSSDGENFVPVGRVEGAGNSTNLLSYGWEDRDPLTGTSYYRLRQTDYDGKTEEFDPVSVNRDNPEESITIESCAPNPFEDYLSLVIRSGKGTSAHFEMYSSSGAIVKNSDAMLNTGTNRIEIQGLSGLLPGMYILKAIIPGAELEPLRVVRK